MSPSIHLLSVSIFNWFIEYLIDTYTGSARLLPMELQTEEDGEIVHGRDKVDPRLIW